MGQPAFAVPLPYRVVRSHAESVDTKTLHLAPVNGELPEIRPGQFNMLYAFGLGEIPISVSGDLSRRGSLVHTVRASGRVSAALAFAEAGQEIGVRGPFGSAWPLDPPLGSDIVVLAGGLGLAPLRSLLFNLLANAERIGRLVVLYGARTPDAQLFVRDLRNWRSGGKAQVLTTVDRATPGWNGRVGVVTNLLSAADFDPARTSAYVCGPEVMMRFSAASLEERGVAASRIYLSMERNMRCAVGLCGHCQLGSSFVCRDGPVYRYKDVASLLQVREL